jgi:muramoyltetrapeptide carboxypeptidase
LSAEIRSLSLVRLRVLNSLSLPPGLTAGATIGVAAVSGPVDEEKLAWGIAYLKAKGYQIREASNLRRQNGFLAGTDEERAAGYRELVRDPVVEAIIFARGGYGSSRVLAHLDAEEVRSNPKIHLGGSDLTALFAFLWRHAELVTFYGPMVAVEMAAGTPDLDWQSVLRGDQPAPHRIARDDIVRAGRAEGVLAGGCLSLLASLAGTPEAILGDGVILFWEDTGEDTYRLDRLLTQLERSGTFDGLRGMVIGSVVPRLDVESSETVRKYLFERFARAPFPVAMGLAAGHLPRPRTLALGVPVRLDLEESPHLSFTGPAVR